MKENGRKVYQLSCEEALEQLKSSFKGLTFEETARLSAIHGKNKLDKAEVRSPLELFIRQFKSGFVLILSVAAIIAFITDQRVDAFIIIAVIILNAVIGFYQEYRAEKSIEALGKLIHPHARVIRNGVEETISAEELVPGDILVLQEGDQIPADARIISAHNLRTMEAALTGESVPVTKQTEAHLEQTSMADRTNMVWSGTFIVSGIGKAVVFAIGSKTEIGKISGVLTGIKKQKTSFQKKTDQLSKQMALLAIGSALIIFVAGYFIRQFDINEVILTAIAALVAAIPEGLPAVITIVLAIGANRMSRRNVIVRDFTSTETLGEVSAILTDKTGTLTENNLTIRSIYMPGGIEIDVEGNGWEQKGSFNPINSKQQFEKGLQRLIKIGVISNDARLIVDKNGDTTINGDPTEAAFLVLGAKKGVTREDVENDIIDELPFSSERKFRASLFKNETDKFICLIGAPEVILEKCNRIYHRGDEQNLDNTYRLDIQEKIASWSNEAKRVIALAYVKTDREKLDSEDLDDLVFMGIVGMIDPPRPNTAEAIQRCKSAGIRVIMVTGDHIKTAEAIARSTGLIDEKGSGPVALEEKDLEGMNEQEFENAIQSVSVFARLNPTTKLKIAESLQKQGHLIAMTGDGVNDAPALKRADVGVSMGIMGTDLAKESADIVLADDNFATVVNAVEEGRIVFKNSRNTSFFLITTNIAESVTLIASIVLGLPLPLTASQLLWLNLVTDGVTDMALATEKGHHNLMNKPRSYFRGNILNRSILPFLFINVIIMSVLTVYSFYHFNEVSIEKARTAAFTVMSFTQLFNVFNLRSTEKSVFAIGFFSNRYINYGVGFSTIVLVGLIYIPVLASIFRFEALSLMEFGILLFASSSVLWATEIYKFMHKIKNTH